MERRQLVPGGGLFLYPKSVFFSPRCVLVIGLARSFLLGSMPHFSTNKKGPFGAFFACPCVQQITYKPCRSSGYANKVSSRVTWVGVQSPFLGVLKPFALSRRAASLRRTPALIKELTKALARLLFSFSSAACLVLSAPFWRALSSSIERLHSPVLRLRASRAALVRWLIFSASFSATTA
jgi:hypothetical protein